jgi:hypothetical protein
MLFNNQHHGKDQFIDVSGLESCCDVLRRRADRWDDPGDATTRISPLGGVVLI